MQIDNGTLHVTRLPADEEEFGQEKVVKEDEDFCYYVRQSNSVLALRVFITQVIAIAAHLLMYLPLFLSSQGGVSDASFNISSAFVATLVIYTFNTSIIMYLTLRWVKTLYIIRPKSIVEHTGIIFTKENDYSTDRIESVTVNQSIFGKLLDYGTVNVFNPVQRDDLNLHDIPHPHVYAHVISKRQPREVVRFFPHREELHRMP